MMHRISFIFILAFALVLAPVSTGSAASHSVSSTFDLSGLPPGIAVKVEPLLAELLHHMMHHHEMGMGEGMSHEHMAAHLAQFQQMIDQLPPGIVVGILEILVDSPCMVMMHFHHAVEEGLLDQPPGQILKFVKALAK